MLFNIAIRTPYIHTIVFFLLLLFFLTWLSLLLLGSMLEIKISREVYSAFATAVSAPIFGFCGQVQYLRNETPGKTWNMVLKEPVARLTGGITMFIGYGGSIISLAYGLLLWLI